VSLERKVGNALSPYSLPTKVHHIFFKDNMTYLNKISFDTETTGLNVYEGARPFCLSLTDCKGKDSYFRWDYDPFTREVTIDPLTLSELRIIFGHRDWLYIAHNAKFDMAMLRSIGVEVKGKVLDTVVMARVQNNARNNYKLKPLCKKLFDFPDEDEKDLKNSVMKSRAYGKKVGWMLAEKLEGDYALADHQLCEKYAVGDTQRCMKLYQFCLLKMSREQLRTFDMEMDLMMVLFKMETKGITIDQKRAAELKIYYKEKIETAQKLKAEMGYGDLNTRSPKQMKATFYDKLKAPHVYKSSKNKAGVRTKKLTCDKGALERWSKDYPLAKALIDINMGQHELGSFIEPLSRYATRDGRVHPNFNQAGAITGRLSCSNPNLQNISNSTTGIDERVSLRARELFVPKEGHVLYFPDYSQMEVWIAAFLSGDKVMIKALLAGLDMHMSFAIRFYGHLKDFEINKAKYRKHVKAGTFAVIYGAGVAGIVKSIGCTNNEAASFIKMFRETYPDLYAYGQDLTSVGYEHGFVENPFGRIYIMNEDTAYKGLNTLVQGSGADIMKRALINIDTLLVNDYKGCDLLLTVHDEACIEVPLKMHSKKLMRDILKAMQYNFHTYFDMPVPFPVDMAWTDTRWSNKKEIEL